MLIDKDEARITLARTILAVLEWEWLDESLSVEARRVLPILFLTLYLAEKDGRHTNKRQASVVMGVDQAKTGPKYIAQCVGRGFLTVEKRDDKRKDYLRTTAELRLMIEHNLVELLEHINRRAK